MKQLTRRTFFGLAASAAASGLASFKVPAALADDSKQLSARAWQTSGNRHHEAIEPPAWRESAAKGAAIVIDPAERFQEILGFGAAFTDASCYIFNQLDQRQRQSLFDEFFSPRGLRLSVCRTCIGASDYSTKPYSFDDGDDPDPELKRFSIDHDRAYILPTLRAARQINPELFLFSSPWSPPGWMKTGGSMLGGSMRKKYYSAYADYFVRFLQGYAGEGVKINGVTIQNEVDTDQDGRMPAALWGQEYEMEFIKDHLGPALQRASLDTRIWILDHNYSLWGRAVDELSDPEVNRFVDGVAWHGYVGSAGAMTRVHQAFPAKHAYWTEGGPDITSPAYATDWAKWSQTYSDILRNWARCIVGWNLALDEKGNPNIGPFPCGGLVTVHSKTGEVTRSGQYYAFAHYSKAINRGARVICSKGDTAHVSHVALENPDGSRVLVVTNQGDAETPLECQIENRIMALRLPSDSVTTVVW